MKLHLTRDSVAIGDDVDAPHFIQSIIDEDATSLDLARLIQSMSYIPNVAGGQATWSIRTDIPIAVIAQQWDEPKLITQTNFTVRELAKDSEYLKVHANYHCQEDPDETLDKLRNENSYRAT